MAADVSYLVRILNGQNEEQMRNEAGHGKSKGLITRDLLGGWSKLGSQELDLDLQVPNGWEKRLDLKSGKVYLQRCSSPISSSSASSSDHKHEQQHHQNDQKQNQKVTERQDLNFPPSTNSSPLLDGTDLDLKLVAPSYDYQSVCTLDKVKSALERAEKASGKKKRLSSPSSSSSLSPTSSIVKEKEDEDDEKKSSSFSGMLFASGCPGCLLYVLISRENPRCPRCGTIVPSPVTKKPRIDLNESV